MDKIIDPSIDWLADAPLTPEQRDVWNTLRTEIIGNRSVLRELERRLKLLEQAPVHDEQTSVLNRPEFNREVARMLAFHERYGGVSSLVYINLEGMENVVSRHDRSVANAALREASDILMKNVRGSDVVGRLAADEFGVLLGQCDNANGWKKSEKLARQLQEGLTEVHNIKLGLRVCYGVYTFRDEGDIASGLKEAAKVMTKVNV